MDASVVGIFTAATAEAPMQALAQIEAKAGQGLSGDRYQGGGGSFSGKESPARQVTLIESEAIAAVNRDCKFELHASETRRNIVTKDVPLNHLVGREFTVGTVRMRGIKLCEPCAHLEKLTGKPVKEALAHRGGLNAEVIIGGVIKLGDHIDTEPEEITSRVTTSALR